MRIIIVGGDGFIGWPLALRLSSNGDEIFILDNLSRRRIDSNLGTSSLTPIKDIQTRIDTWTSITKRAIGFKQLDVATDYEELCATLQTFKPHVIVHLGEQRSAPYSMKGAAQRRYTVNNNINATHNILSAITDCDRNIHLVHLGTMGVYGYGVIPNTVIPEGYITVKIAEQPVEIYHPTYPGSIYHMTKSQDALLFQFYQKNYKLRITDLHQGIIWGAQTKETMLHEDLVNRFDYDSDYGTVLNRFIVQAAINTPLTIYGTGEQTRAFIHIENSMDCIELAIQTETQEDRVKIYNQITETHRLIDLANLIGKPYEFLDNPRNELKTNELVVKNDQFLKLGLKPICLNKEAIQEIYTFVLKYKDNIDKRVIYPSSSWK